MRTLIILGTIPLWPLLLIVGVCYGARLLREPPEFRIM
jgi:hypothetical protein